MIITTMIALPATTIVIAEADPLTVTIAIPAAIDMIAIVGVTDATGAAGIAGAEGIIDPSAPPRGHPIYRHESGYWRPTAATTLNQNPVSPLEGWGFRFYSPPPEYPVPLLVPLSVPLSAGLRGASSSLEEHCSRGKHGQRIDIPSSTPLFLDQ
ncbi:MAG: hypothetical protein GY849_00180 [Deltaproteobacteria bacterium]|nr:hypothetical protein [Deltaproteobacteria bacterium]